MHLPAAADIAIRNFEIRLAGALPANPLPLEVIAAKSLTIAGEAAETWFQMPATSDTKADVDRNNGKKITAKRTPDLIAVPIAVAGEERFTVQVAVPAPP